MDCLRKWSTSQTAQPRDQNSATTRVSHQRGGCAQPHSPISGSLLSGKEGAQLNDPTIHVVEPDEVGLSHKAADLDFDQFERNLSRVDKPMHAADRDIDRFVLVHGA